VKEAVDDAVPTAVDILYYPNSTMIEFRLDGHAGVMTYLQIVQQVRRALLVGRLLPGDQLPTVREVVAKLAINPNTVLKAYRQLEHEGVLVSRPGAGTFIRQDVRIAPRPGQAALGAALARWMHRARREGLDDNDLRAVFDDVLRNEDNKIAAAQ